MNKKNKLPKPVERYLGYNMRMKGDRIFLYCGKKINEDQPKKGFRSRIHAREFAHLLAQRSVDLKYLESISNLRSKDRRTKAAFEAKTRIDFAEKEMKKIEKLCA